MSESEQSHQEFGKYDAQGAYHWRQMRSSLRRFNAGLAARYEIALSLLVQHCNVKEVRKVLDIGCGDGYFTSQVARLFPDSEVDGYDFSQRGIELAREMCPYSNVRFAIGDAFAGHDNEKFDLITATDVIEHLDDYLGFLCKCHALLGRNGRLLVSTPVRIKENPDDPYHVHEFFQNELRTEISNCGFQVLEHTASHDYRVLENYGRRYSFMGIGRMRLGKYHANFLSLIAGRNPFANTSAQLPTMQYVIAEKACSEHQQPPA